ncbi:MAG: GH39 family glycosyl hydrolase [Isosphaeraceae bacterium]
MSTSLKKCQATAIRGWFSPVDLRTTVMKPLCHRALRIAVIGLALATPPAIGQEQSPPGAFPVAIRVDAARPGAEMKPVWRFFGHDEPNYTYMPDGKRLLGQLAALSPDPVYIRTHNLLTSGDGTPALKWGSTGVYSEDDQGRPHYDWTILDRIFDTYREKGVRPYVQIGFMPEALSTRPAPYQHRWKPGGRESISTGWAYPPKDYQKWAELVFQWVKHSVERYGKAEVETWYWEVWNEPNIMYWRGTAEEYHKLYDHAADAVKRALPTARVGGPHVAGTKSPGATKFLRDFLDHCLHGRNHATGQVGSPLDFVAFHAKGAPRFVDGHVQTGISAQIQDIDRGFEVVASYPELKNIPVIIGESDPDGCAACPSSIYPQNGYRNGTLYASYTAAAFARKYALAERHGVHFDGAVTWAFEFENQPYFAGFRVLSTNGVPLPVMNVFRMFGLMGGRRLAVASSGEIGLDDIRAHGVLGRPDVSALACVRGGKLAILAWHHHDIDVPGPAADVELTLVGLPAGTDRILLEHFRVDSEHGNAFEAWKQMGSPQAPTPVQRAALERSSNLALIGSPDWVKPDRGTLKLRFALPRQAVSLLVLDAGVR